MNHVYIIECRTEPSADVRYTNISYYVGRTSDPKRRLTQHRFGKGARYLRGRWITCMIVADEKRDSFSFGGPDPNLTEHAIKHGQLFDGHWYPKWSHDDKRTLVNAVRNGTLDTFVFPTDVFNDIYCADDWKLFWTRCEKCRGYGFGTKGIANPKFHPEYGLPPYKPGDFWCVECNGEGGIYHVDE